jgi:MoaA/NifB/PqqE/SkfB family radical SAM enzyme
MNEENFSSVIFLPSENRFSTSDPNIFCNTKGPLSVGLQITRRCNLNCAYCSEPYTIRKELNLCEVEHVIRELSSAETKIVKLTGGEPLLRRDFFRIAELARKEGLHVAVDTNATLVTNDIAARLAETMLYVETTVDGLPSTHNKIRGRFDEVLVGIRRLSATGVPLLFATVACSESLADIKYVIKLADNFGVKTVKILTPIPKGRGTNLPERLFDANYLVESWNEICEYKAKINSNVKLILLDWKTVGKGSVVIIQPDGLVIGSPSRGEPGCITPIGNLFAQSLQEMWKGYPYKNNHIRKCLETSILLHGSYPSNDIPTHIVPAL